MKPAALVAFSAFLAIGPTPTQAPTSAQPPRPAVSVTAGPDGRLSYATDTAGNAVVDFSHAGYGGGGVTIPDAPVRLVVGASGGDDRASIQAALELVGTMAPDTNGLRGAVLLKPGHVPHRRRDSTFPLRRCASRLGQR